MSTWSCPACTFINPNSRGQCDICGTAKPAQTSNWVCAVCTFSNSGHSQVCDMCSSPKPSDGPGGKPVLSRQKSAGQIEQENMLKLNSLFGEFEGEDEDKGVMADENLTRFYGEIGVPEDHRNVLAIAWKLDAKDFGEFSRQEFVDGFTRLDCMDLASIKKWVKRLNNDLKKKSEFSKFYKWVFTYSKENDAKTMARDQATQIWQMLLTGTYSSVDSWVEFLESDKCELRSVSSDLWNQVLDFTYEVKDDLSDYDENDNWHSCLDDYVEYLKEKREN